MKIYKAETALAEQIKQNSTMSSLVEVKPVKKDDVALASMHNTEIQSPDLFPVVSVLVSSVWNDNDDVFLKEELWAARHTPTYHLDNMYHDDDAIVGSMVETWVQDDFGNVISDDAVLSAVPDIINLVVLSVVYTYWQDEYKEERAQMLIEDIMDGYMQVSMEVRFFDFDYAIRLPGQTKFAIIERNENTAFLTQYLRVFGGSGTYQGHQIGRVLRNMVFIGKGYTPDPANSRSKILSYGSKDGVLSSVNIHNNPEICMSDIQKEFDALKADHSAALESIKTLTEKLADAEAKLADAAEASTVEKLESELVDTKAKLDEAAAKLAESEALAAKVDELTSALSEKETELKNMARAAELVGAGFDAEAAAEKVKLYEALSDEQWEPIKEVLTQPATAEVDLETQTDDSTASVNTDTDGYQALFGDVEEALASLVTGKGDE